MIRAYLNYPNPRLELHSDPGCEQIQKNQKKAQRSLEVNIQTFTETCATITSSSFRMGSNALTNDVWISVDFSDRCFEEAVVNYLVGLLGQRYGRLQNVPVCKHC